MPKITATAVSQPQSIVQQFQSIQLIVTPDKTHDFLMSTENVAKGYGVSAKTIQNHKIRNVTEILENTHFISDLQIVGLKNGMTKKRTLWTKRGVIRLGMFIKSQRAIKFRDWAENLIVNSSQRVPTIAPKVPTVSLPNLTQVADGVFYLNEGVPCKRFYNYRFTEDFIIKLLIRKISFISEQISQKEWREYSNALKTVNSLTGETLYHPQAVEKAALLWDVDYLTELLINKK